MISFFFNLIAAIIPYTCRIMYLNDSIPFHVSLNRDDQPILLVLLYCILPYSILLFIVWYCILHTQSYFLILLLNLAFRLAETIATANSSLGRTTTVAPAGWRTAEGSWKPATGFADLTAGRMELENNNIKWSSIAGVANLFVAEGIFCPWS